MTRFRSTLVLVTLALVLGHSSAQAQGWRDVMRGIFGGATPNAQTGALLETEIVAALRDALAQGTTTAVNQLGQPGGFWTDAARRIPPPPLVVRSEAALRAMGLGASVDTFHQTLNSAAEQAVPQAANILGAAVRSMSLADARDILNGADDAATRYFQRVAGPELRTAFMPIIGDATSKVGVTQQYRAITQGAGSILARGGASAALDLDTYVTDQALKGLFSMMADEERRIRENPAARGTEIMKRVFGSRSGS
jgi:hypothetical protein